MTWVVKCFKAPESQGYRINFSFGPHAKKKCINPWPERKLVQRSSAFWAEWCVFSQVVFSSETLELVASMASLTVSLDQLRQAD